MSEMLYRRFETPEGYSYAPIVYDFQPVAFESLDGEHWQPAKQVPYYPNWFENLQCAFGFHELCDSKKYTNTKYCFRCGKRRVY